MPVVHCAMTGVPIRSGPAILIPLAPAPNALDNRVRPTLAGCAHAITDGGRTGLFSPFTLPLRVTVEEFGCVGTILLDDAAELTSQRLARFTPGSADPASDDRPLWALARSAITTARLPAAMRLARAYARQWDALNLTAPRESYAWDGRVAGTWVSVEAWRRFSQGIFCAWTYEPAAAMYPELRRQRATLTAFRRSLPPEEFRKVRYLTRFDGTAATLAPEMLALYGPTLFREATLPALAALLCFTTNLTLAGRFLAPVMACGQDAHTELHCAIAEVTRELLAREVEARDAG